MTRKEHIDWAKERALEYADSGDLQGAFASFQSDMAKHDETRNHITLPLFSQLYIGEHLNTPEKMRDCIEGFN
jgi:hypothetical protein